MSHFIHNYKLNPIKLLNIKQFLNLIVWDLKLVFGNLGIRLKPRTLALVLPKIRHFIQNSNLNPFNKNFKKSSPWGLGPRSMFCAIWVQIINQDINLELQFSQDFSYIHNCKGNSVNFVPPLGGLESENNFWESLESTDERLLREHWLGFNNI